MKKETARANPLRRTSNPNISCSPFICEKDRDSAKKIRPVFGHRLWTFVLVLVASCLVNTTFVQAQSPAEIARLMVARIPDPTYKRLRSQYHESFVVVTNEEKAAINDWNAALNEFSQKRSQQEGKKADAKKQREVDWKPGLVEVLAKAQELYDDRGRFRPDLAASYGVRLRQFPVALLPRWELQGRTSGWPQQIFNIIRLPGLFDGERLNEDAHRKYQARFVAIAGDSGLDAGRYWSSAQGGGRDSAEGEPYNMYNVEAEYNLISVAELFPNDQFDKAKFLAAYPIALEMLSQERAKSGITLIAAVGSSKTIILDESSPRVLHLLDGQTALWVNVNFGESNAIDLRSVILNPDFKGSSLPLMGVDISCANSMTAPPSFRLLRPIDSRADKTGPVEAINAASPMVELMSTDAAGPLLTIKQAGASVCFLFVTSGKPGFSWFEFNKKWIRTPGYITNLTANAVQMTMVVPK